MPPERDAERGALEQRIAALERRLQAFQKEETQRRDALHQIRSPLTAIIGFAETLAAQVQDGTADDAKTADRLRRISEAARRVGTLLDSLETNGRE